MFTKNLEVHRIIYSIEHHALDTNEGKQKSKAETNVSLTLVLRK
jgi:hypothetical protein